MPTINDTPRDLKDMDFSLAQLRHAYSHLMRWEMTEFARGLISPEIQRLERLRTRLAAHRTVS